MFETIVVGVRDLEAGRDALRLAQALASSKAKLTLAHVEVTAGKPAPDSGAVGSAARHRQALERLAALREDFRVDAEIASVEAHRLRRGLHDMARARAADLLVVSASYEDEIYRALVGDGASDLLDDPPCALAIAPLGYAARRASMRTIGVAYDRAADSDSALAIARELAADRHAKVSAFHAVSGLDPQHFADNIDEEAAQARERLAQLGDLEAHAEYGNPAEELLRYGGSVDLLVLGSHRHGPVSRLLGPGTAQRLVDEPPCPLLVVARDGRAAARAS